MGAMVDAVDPDDLVLVVDGEDDSVVAVAGGAQAGKVAAELLAAPVRAVAEELSISEAQAYALVRNGELPAIKIGGRGQWRVERSRLEEYIASAYHQTEQFVAEHPLDSS
jgi:excisionase family DNA binding protein